MMTIKSHRSNLSCWIFLFFIIGHAAAQPSQVPYGYNGNNINPSVGIIIIALVVALFLLGFFSMYVRHCTGDSPTYHPTLRLSANQAAGSRRGPRGLDNAVIESFPTFDYSSVKSLHIGKGALECAVCLNDFQDDETLRLIPKCDHVFHPECIDAWLLSHTTCPVCRAELTPQPGESLHAPSLDQITEGPIGDAVVVDMVGQPVSPPVQCETELMERPLNPAVPPAVSGLNRSRTRRNASGRPGWLGVLFTRSNSTGHVTVKAQWENMERFTLRLPEEVRSRIIRESLNRNPSIVALPRQASSRRGYRAGPSGPVGPGGEGSSRGRRFGSWRFDRAARSDRWAFSLAPPFFTRGPSVRSPKVAAAGGGEGGSVHSSKAADSVHAATSSETNLPPV